MKTYDVHRYQSCPTGEHTVYDEATGKDVTRDCTCPALVVRAVGPPGPAMPHMMMWSRSELARLVNEFDRGYFDADESAPRRLSMFVSAFQSELLDLVERNPIAAVVRMLSRCVFDQVAFDTWTMTLSLRLMPGQWAVIRLPTGADAEIEYELMDEPWGKAPAVLWARPVSDREQELTAADIREQVRELLTGPGYKPSTAATTTLQDDDEQLTEVVLGQLADMAEQIGFAELPPAPAAEIAGPCQVVKGCERPAYGGPACEVHRGGMNLLPVEPARGRSRPAKAKAPAAKKRLPPKKDTPK